ncbi:MAG: hypothetical protein M1834_008571 [Cirrosporium novae-zelandiae]|nr:MAG: hypothetical protein M1834_008571 [Cirrosporium novae-zelandiae]
MFDQIQCYFESNTLVIFLEFKDGHSWLNMGVFWVPLEVQGSADDMNCGIREIWKFQVLHNYNEWMGLFGTAATFGVAFSEADDHDDADMPIVKTLTTLLKTWRKWLPAVEAFFNKEDKDKMSIVSRRRSL